MGCFELYKDINCVCMFVCVLIAGICQAVCAGRGVAIVPSGTASTSRGVPLWGGAAGGGAGEAVGGVLPGTGEEGDSLGYTEQRPAPTGTRGQQCTIISILGGTDI